MKSPFLQLLLVLFAFATLDGIANADSFNLARNAALMEAKSAPVGIGITTASPQTLGTDGRAVPMVAALGTSPQWQKPLPGPSGTITQVRHAGDLDGNGVTDNILASLGEVSSPGLASQSRIAVTEPSFYLLLGTALIGLAGIGRKKLNRKR